MTAFSEISAHVLEIATLGVNPTPTYDSCDQDQTGVTCWVIMCVQPSWHVTRLLHKDYWCASSSETSRFNWDVVLGFSIESIQIILMTKAPIIWMLLTSLVVEHH